MAREHRAQAGPLQLKVLKVLYVFHTQGIEGVDFGNIAKLISKHWTEICHESSVIAAASGMRNYYGRHWVIRRRDHLFLTDKGASVIPKQWKGQS